MSAPAIAELVAGPTWRAIDVISDLHLQAAEPATFAAWRRFMGSTPADAVIILGDLFDAWPGDDSARQPGFAADCADVLQDAAARRPVFFLHGNRDFLVGDELARRTGLQLLRDPAALSFVGQRLLLTHGDALCLADTEYLRFRGQVRSAAWQREFLARPLADRQQVAQSLRSESEARKLSGANYADVDADEALGWLRAANADTLVHGHTHRPGEHVLDDAGRRRVVLTDWDLAALPPRGEVLRVSALGLQRLPLP
ncbi:MAG: UDP-2,3-diacylglucosamine diphosphatase [Variovorax sp.]